MTSRIAKANELAADLANRIRDTNSPAEARAVAMQWQQEVEALGDKILTALANQSYTIVRHMEMTADLQVAKARGEGIIIQGDLRVGDQYQAGQAGAMGPGAKAEGMTFNQIWMKAEKDINLGALSSDLVKVRKAMKSKADGSAAHDKAIAAVAEAEDAAKSGDGPKALGFLKTAGMWALDVAKDVTADVAAAAIKASMGVP